MTKRVSHIFLSGGRTKGLSPQAEANIKTTLAHLEGHEHHLYDDRLGRELIENHFNQHVLEAYDELVPYSYKADLLKYCILYLFGGWYFDIGVKCIKSLNADENSPFSLIAFRDLQTNAVSSWACSCGVIWSKRQNPVFKECITQVIRNVKNRYYGVNKLAPTGPLVFGESIVKKNTETNICFGDHRELTPGYRETNRAFVLANGEIFAFGKSRSEKEENDSLGFAKELNYKDLWEKRLVYRSQ